MSMNQFDLDADEGDIVPPFCSGCLELGIDNGYVEDLKDTLYEFDQEIVFKGVRGSPTLDGFKQVLDNIRATTPRNEVKNLLDQGDIIHGRLSPKPSSRSATPLSSPAASAAASFFTPISSSIAFSSMSYLSPSPSFLGIKNVPTNSRGFFLLTLLDLMAVSSKIGQGNEDYCDVMAGSDMVAERLLSDNEVVAFVDKYLKAIRPLKSSFNALKFPIDFAFNYLVTKDLKEGLTSSPNSTARNLLIKSRDNFVEVQETSFNSCLTEASKQSAKILAELYDTSNDSYGFDEALLNPELELLCIQTRIKCRHTIEDRINEPFGRTKDHINEAISWVRNSFRLDPDTERRLANEFDLLVKPEAAKAEALVEQQAGVSSRRP